MTPHAANPAGLAGRGDHQRRAFELNYGVFHGTAFCLAPNLFLTAAHVFQDAKADGEVAVARLTPGQHHAQIVEGR
jgi:V8-like Glu-specific endopeptidase